MPTALITGASGGIGASYARKLAARGYDLVLVARSTARLEALANDLRQVHGIAVETLTADLSQSEQLETVAQRLRAEPAIDLLVNNAGASLAGNFGSAKSEDLDALIRLNVTAPTLLASAAVHGMAARGAGAIINIGSVTSFLPERFVGIYSATKSYILTLSHSLAAEFGPQGIYVQALVPAATRTDIWAHAGVDVATLPNVMEVEDLVDAALLGFDRKEAVTIPPLADEALWLAYETARMTLPSGLSGSPAPRYLTRE